MLQVGTGDSHLLDVLLAGSCQCLGGGGGPRLDLSLVARGSVRQCSAKALYLLAVLGMC